MNFLHFIYDRFLVNDRFFTFQLKPFDLIQRDEALVILLDERLHVVAHSSPASSFLSLRPLVYYKELLDFSFLDFVDESINSHLVLRTVDMMSQLANRIDHVKLDDSQIRENVVHRETKRHAHHRRRERFQLLVDVVGAGICHDLLFRLCMRGYDNQQVHLV